MRKSINEFPLVSIVVVNWNARHLLEDCINSILNQSYNNLEITVVDNASSDKSVEFLEKKYSEISIKKNSKNYGFPKACNVGINCSSGKYILFLNPDVRLESEAIYELVKVAEKDKEIGICASKMLLLNNPKIINSTGLFLCRDGTTSQFGDGEEDDARYDKILEVFAVPGAAMFCRKKMIEEVGNFDEDFFLYYEDLDLSWRARLYGWKCVFVPTSRVYHLRNSTIKKYPEIHRIARYYHQRNRVLFLLKNLSFSSILQNLPSILKYDLLMVSKSIFHLLRYGSYPVEIKARLDVIKYLNKILNKRMVQHKRTISRI